MLSHGKIHITLDGQFGSTGKGLLNSAIVKHLLKDLHGPKLITVSNAAPNAGHTYVDHEGKKRTVFHLPVSGVLIPNSVIYLCAGSIIDPRVLQDEMDAFGIDPQRVFIDPRACIVLDAHKNREGADVSGATQIASTQKGVGAALADKVARAAGMRVAGQYYKANRQQSHVTPRIERLDLMNAMDHGSIVLMEVPQGFGLSLNHGFQYPQCTSRDLTVAQALNDAGVHPRYLGEVFVSMRTYPIRVGNIVKDGVEIGNSGDFYPDSRELTWEEMGEEAELTTVTKRVRRVATFSYMQLDDMFRMLRPNHFFLNFCNYLKSQEEFVNMVKLIEAHAYRNQVHIKEWWFGFGPGADQVIRCEQNPRHEDLVTLWSIGNNKLKIG